MGPDGIRTTRKFDAQNCSSRLRYLAFFDSKLTNWILAPRAQAGLKPQRIKKTGNRAENIKTELAAARLLFSMTSVAPHPRDSLLRLKRKPTMQSNQLPQQSKVLSSSSPFMTMTDIARFSDRVAFKEFIFARAVVPDRQHVATSQIRLRERQSSRRVKGNFTNSTNSFRNSALSVVRTPYF